MQTSFACVGDSPQTPTKGADPLLSTPGPTLRGLDAVNVWPFNHHEGRRPAPLDPCPTVRRLDARQGLSRPMHHNEGASRPLDPANLSEFCLCL